MQTSTQVMPDVEEVIRTHQQRANFPVWNVTHEYWIYIHLRYYNAKEKNLAQVL